MPLNFTREMMVELVERNFEDMVKQDKQDKENKKQELRDRDIDDYWQTTANEVDKIIELNIDRRIKNLELYVMNGLHDKHVLQKFRMANGKLHTLFTHNRAILLNNHEIIGSINNGEFEIFVPKGNYNKDSKKIEYINKFHGLIYEDFIAK